VSIDPKYRDEVLARSAERYGHQTLSCFDCVVFLGMYGGPCPGHATPKEKKAVNDEMDRRLRELFGTADLPQFKGLPSD
jgi:hypothetical protein